MGTNRMERLHVIGAAVAALVIVLVGWFFLISPQRSDTDNTRGQISDAQLENMTLQTRVTQLTGEQRKRGTYAAALAAAREALPSDTDMSTFLRGMQAIGAATSTTVTAVNVGTATPVTAPAAVAPGAGAPSPATGTPAAPTSGIFEIPITANVTGSADGLSAFLTRLQTGQPRAVLVTEVTLGGGAGTSATMQLKITAFVAPVSTSPATAAATTSDGGD